LYVRVKEGSKGNEVTIHHDNIILTFDNLMMNNRERKSFQEFMIEEEKKVSD
jgi:hypothetical protein